MSVSIFHCRGHRVFFVAVMSAVLTWTGCGSPPSEVIDVTDAEFQSLEDYSAYDVESERLSLNQPLWVISH